MSEAPFPVGSYVTNSKVPDWGTGKVLALGDQGKRQVLFEFGGVRLMPMDVLLAASAPQRHPLFSRVDARTDVRGVRSFLQLEKAFTDAFTQGFEDPAYLSSEREYKVAAAAQMAELCSSGELASLLAQGAHAEVCERAKRLVSKTNLIFPNEKMALSDGLKRGEAEQRRFATAFFDVLYGDGDFGPRFEAFAAVLEELDALKWTTATYFLFLAHPDRHPFVKPSNMQEAAKAYAFDIGYDSRPNWRSYSRMQDFVRYVAGVLERRGGMAPRDCIDVQGFIWCSLQAVSARKG